jgi:hypothetical protein
MSGSTRRIAHGRGHRYELDGERALGVTTATDKGVAKPNLIRWAAKSVAGYAIDHWSELESMKPSERLKVLEGAPWAERDEAAVRGRDVHSLVERLAAGEELAIPEALVGHVDAYLKFVEDWRPKELLVEATVVNRTYRYMGTLDLIADLADGLRWLLDWKTGASGIWPETALQLAAYRHAETYLTDDGEESLPSVDRVGALWLRADGYDLIPVKAEWDEFRRFQYAQQMAAFVELPRDAVIGEALTPPTLEEVAS